ncbi:MAG TPA: M56 family metallopeptidase [Verrucomicrobiae bacterium]|nr:M56 family metallopeptidase [Verrucomicrobiae bacterium]
MSECVETLNHRGETFLSFALPMLWQSSLLIAVLFAFDLLSARRIRASVRYALWMVVLVKLVLPPALSLPTGATWWLWRTHPAVEPPVIQNYSVSFGDTVPDNFVAPAGVVVLPPPKFSGDGWALLVAIATAAGLLSWLAFRWLRVAQNVRRAATAPGEWDAILEEARQLTGLRQLPRLKLIDDAQTPAVYGLLRPVILLPRALAAKLSVRQLRAVLLHETVHLRRGDVWTNCAQTLLQIAYWWHPLLWLANARIRRLREEAVDDAVMLALRDGADAYAPTLLEVAKYAFRRPLASLGLVGILESRSALRQRVERLVDFRPPRKAGITFLSLCGIFAFSAVALPMGQGPEETPDSFSTPADSNDTTMTLHVNPDLFIRNIKARADWTMKPNTNDYSAIISDILEENGVHCSPPHGLSFNKKTGEVKTLNTPEQLEIIRRVIEELNRPDGKWTLVETNRPVGKVVLIQAELFWMTDAHFEKMIAGATWHRGRNGAAPSWTADPGQLETINQRIKSMGLHPVARPRIQTGEGITAELYVGNSTNAFRIECDPLVHDTNIFLAVNVESISVSVQHGLKTTHVFEVDSKVTADDDGGIAVRAPNANGSSNLVAVLNVRIVSTGRAAATPGLEMRTFKVNPRTFYSNLKDNVANNGAPYGISRAPTGEMTKMAATFFSSLGVDLDPPKTVYYNDGLGVLFVYATPQDLDIISRAIQVLSCAPPQIHIKARFIEVPRTFFSRAVVKSSFRGLTNGWVLPNPDFRVLLHEIESPGGSEELAEPEATTLCGRQTQMRATITQPIVTNFTAEASTGASVPQTEHVETGPILDVFPNLLSDGYTIQLKTIASHIDFLGYSSSRGLVPNVTANIVGSDFSPVFQASEAALNKNLYDGQTLVLFPKYRVISDGKTEDRISEAVKEKNRDKVEIVFVTATLIDAAGNRLHSDDEVRFAQKYVPSDQFPSSGGVSWLEQ